MNDKFEVPQIKRTSLDFVLARAYFDVLLDLALNFPGKVISYGELVSLTRKRNESSEWVRSAIATNIGRRLDTLREITNLIGVPDLSGLVVNRSSGDNGVGFKRSFNGDEVRASIRTYPWEQLKVKLSNEIDKRLSDLSSIKENTAKKKSFKRKSVDEAALEVWEYYKLHKHAMPKFSQAEKSALIQLVCKRIDVAEAVQQLIDQKGLNSY
jgi:hypothetical protein